MKKNFMLIVALAAMLFFAAPMTTEAAEGEGSWKQNATGWWYEYSDGSYLTDGMFEIDGEWYYFDAAGYMKTGWLNLSDTWYYFDNSGAMVTDWQMIGGAWYYFDLYDGWMYTDSEYKIDGALYLFGANGAWKGTPGWNKQRNIWYYMNGAGQLTTGWKMIGGEWYWFDSDGWMADDGFYKIDGKDYLFNKDGVLQDNQGWNWAKDAWYYLTLDADGAIINIATEWKQVGSKWYYFEPNEDDDSYGQMYYGGVHWSGDVKYFLANDGAMVTGWYNYADAYQTPEWVYCNADGSVYDGWLGSGKTWYYIDEGWMMQEQWYYEHTTLSSGVTAYYLGKDGLMVYGWYHAQYYDDCGTYYDEWIYTDPNTGIAYDGWVSSGGKWYYIDDGQLQRATTVWPDAESPQWDDYAGADGYLDSDEYAAWDAAMDAYDKKGYIVGTDGAMVSGGWYKFNSSYGSHWYYAEADGSVYDGWLQDGGNWYYISYGHMITNQYIDGCWIGADGVWR